MQSLTEVAKRVAAEHTHEGRSLLLSKTLQLNQNTNNRFKNIAIQPKKSNQQIVKQRQLKMYRQ